MASMKQSKIMPMSRLKIFNFWDFMSDFLLNQWRTVPGVEVQATPLWWAATNGHTASAEKLINAVCPIFALCVFLRVGSARGAISKPKMKGKASHPFIELRFAVSMTLSSYCCSRVPISLPEERWNRLRCTLQLVAARPMWFSNSCSGVHRSMWSTSAGKPRCSLLPALMSAFACWISTQPCLNPLPQQTSLLSTPSEKLTAVSSPFLSRESTAHGLRSTRYF